MGPSRRRWASPVICARASSKLNTSIWRATRWDYWSSSKRFRAVALWRWSSNSPGQNLRSASPSTALPSSSATETPLPNSRDFWNKARAFYRKASLKTARVCRRVIVGGTPATVAIPVDVHECSGDTNTNMPFQNVPANEVAGFRSPPPFPLA